MKVSLVHAKIEKLLEMNPLNYWKHFVCSVAMEQQHTYYKEVSFIMNI